MGTEKGPKTITFLDHRPPPQVALGEIKLDAKDICVGLERIVEALGGEIEIAWPTIPAPIVNVEAPRVVVEAPATNSPPVVHVEAPHVELYPNFVMPPPVITLDPKGLFLYLTLPLVGSLALLTAALVYYL